MSYEQGAIWLCIIGGLVFVAWFFGYRKYIFHMKEKKQIWDALVLDGASIPKQEYAKFLTFPQYTPQGCKVWSTVKVPPSALRNLEIGAENAIFQYRKAKPNYTKNLSIKDFFFVLIDPMAVLEEGPDAGAPAINVNGTKSAGTLIGNQQFSHAKHPYIVTAHQERVGWKFNDYLVRSVWAEAEHNIEYKNDINDYLSHTGENDHHPIQFDPSIPIIPAV